MNIELAKTLKDAEAVASASRLQRLASIPVRFLVPLALQKLARTKSITARTFFGREMKVVLPEGISVRIWRYGSFEPDVAFYLLASLKKGDTFVDIGGHFGFFSMLGRELVGPAGTVITFEPMPATRAILQENLSRHAAPAAQVLIPAAAGASHGKLVFKDFGITGSAFATAGEDRDGNLRLCGTVEVDVLPLDVVLERNSVTTCKLVKIDAENAEYEVVCGAMQALKKMRPNLVLETGDFAGGATRRVLDLLLPLGYLPFEFSAWQLAAHQVRADYGYQNLLLVHRDRLGEIDASLFASAKAA